MNSKLTYVDQPIRVMLVEDEALLRTIAKCVLEREGKVKVVAQAVTGEAAVEIYRNARPDVVIMDLQMPGAGGIVATTQIVAQDRDAKILIWSCDARDTTVHRVRGAGALGFVDKLAPNEVLEQAVHRVATGAPFVSRGMLGSDEAEGARSKPPSRGSIVRDTWKHLGMVPMPCPLLAQEM